MCIKIKALDQLFGFSGGKEITINGNCSNCGRTSIVNITKTDSGYGFIGGILYSTDFFQHFIIECDHCFDVKTLKKPY